MYSGSGLQNEEDHRVYYCRVKGRRFRMPFTPKHLPKYFSMSCGNVIKLFEIGSVYREATHIDTIHLLNLCWFSVKTLSLSKTYWVCIHEDR